MNRRSTLLASVAAAPLLLALAACGPAGEGEGEGDAAVDSATMPGEATPPPASTPPMQPEPIAPGEMDDMGAPSQAEALALLTAVNEHEIAVAEQAREKQLEGEVMEYAELMHSEHSANLEATRTLADPGADVADSPRLEELRSSGQATLDRLSALEGEEYAQAYIEAMVQDHQKALDMLENDLIPAAEDDAVREHLTTTRDTIAAHLEQAQALQSQ